MLTFAYIDPGSGLLIWQAIMAALVGLVFYLKKSRDFVMALCAKIFNPNKPR